MSSSLVLASASPRRRELLNQIGLAHTVLPVNIDETPLDNEQPLALVTRLAQQKAEQGFEAAQGVTNVSQSIVLAADTIVVYQGVALGKPIDADDHNTMLSKLSNKTHQVITAFSIKSSQAVYTEAVSSDVTFMALNKQQIANYWLSGEPQDKAGGYAIQGYGATFVKHLSGSYTGVVGLPLFECANALKRFGVEV
ncbi:septum formation inhibitor Maf [Alteromonas sediminis]|uniref:dTTP/UTP pyrophosphatase n=1 Tax=Alteromonas sediminis TaxID=2259342 RepID=A0A3N5Y534_9ALTE|nr:Maf family protein [Alteromonas sediminis]RPJ65319.1 septum formation inhibitor Maf [Alteromonas sediminis]